MRRDLSPSDFDALLETNRQSAAEQRFADEHNPSPRARWGRLALAAAAPWLAIFIGINAPAIYKLLFGA